MIRLVGDITDASTHFAQVGLAAILKNAGVPDVRLFWEDGSSARAAVTWNGEVNVGQIVKDHATRCCQKDSWVSKRGAAEEDKKLGLFSPRVTARKTQEEFVSWAKDRQDALDTLPMAYIDRSMIGALGEPAYWHWALVSGGKGLKPDYGASRYDMTIRRHGTNFIPRGLSKYAEFISKRTEQVVVDGLTGDDLVDDFEDDIGKGDHTTPLGFRNRSPMDTAIAWCMLWGISATTLVPRRQSDIRTKGVSQTSGVYPRDRVPPAHITLPVFTKPTSVYRWSSVFRSRAWDEIVQTSDIGKVSPVAITQLVSWGVDHGVRFEVEVAETKKAPEWRLKNGAVFRITDARG